MRKWEADRPNGLPQVLDGLFAELVLDAHPLISSSVACAFRGLARSSRAGHGGAGQGDHDPLNLDKAVGYMLNDSWKLGSSSSAHDYAGHEEKMSSFKPELLIVSHSLLIVDSQQTCGLTQGKTKP